MTLVGTDMENSNPSFEILSPELLLTEKSTMMVDISCCSGHTCSTQPLSDCDYEEEYDIWNTHTSILNITASDDEEEEEDEENEPMLLIDDTFSSSPEFAPQDARTVATIKKDDHSILDRMGDLMDSFCAPTPQDPRLEQDLEHLMGCFSPPDAQEMQVFSNTHRWLNRLFCHKHDDSVTCTKTTPCKSSLHQRCRKIHRLLQARRLPQEATLRSVQSFSLVKPKVSEEPNAYDSDPDDLLWSDKRRAPKRKQQKILMEPTIQQTLNTSWDLLLHTNGALQTVHVWMERGTLIHAHSMIEPRLMWRTNIMGLPQNIWLLQIARIRACDSTDEIPTFAQAHTSFIVRTHTEQFVFQAKDATTRDVIVKSWKAAIARFAALAVLEDANSILNEFFVLPTLS